MSDQPEKKPTAAEMAGVSRPAEETKTEGSAQPTSAAGNDNAGTTAQAETKQTGTEQTDKKEPPKPPTVEELKQQIVSMSADIVRGKRETRKAELEVNKKDALITDLKRDNERLKTQVDESKKQGFEKFARDLLQVADNLERALAHLPETKLEDMQVNAFATGVGLTSKQLSAVFNKYGIEKMDAQGKEFDPTKHEAVMSCEKDGVESGHVAEVLQSGYTLNGKLLRPARVSVAP